MVFWGVRKRLGIYAILKTKNENKNQFLLNQEHFSRRLEIDGRQSIDV